VVDRQFAGGSLDWLSPFALFCGVALIVAYALLGCTWLIMKTEGKLQEQMHNLARPLAFVVLAVIGIVSIWTPLAHPDIASRWFTLPNLFWFLPVPILVLVTMYALVRAVARNAHYAPFLLTLVLIFPGLQRPGHQPVAEHHPAVGLDLGGCRAATEPGLYAGGHAVHHPVHPGLHLLELLRVPRQGDP
jgi:hypothetical protein